MVSKIQLFVLTVLLMIWSVRAAYADSLPVDYYSPDNILRFADYLFRSEDYMRAVGEYQRYLFSFDSCPVNADTIMHKTAECYRLNDDYATAVKHYSEIVNTFPNSALIHEVRFKTSLCHYLLDNYTESMTELGKIDSDYGNKTSDVRVDHLRAANFIHQKDWNLAMSTLRNRTDSVSIQLTQYAHAGAQLPRKSKTLAGLYSAIIPGSGKFYCGRTLDGIQSLATTTVLGWQAYDGFHADGTRSAKGWIFGILGGIFYLGNIYGSVVAADIHNEEHEEALFQKVRLYVTITFD
jgi:TM2 domain-containing membrane protein YozV